MERAGARLEQAAVGLLASRAAEDVYIVHSPEITRALDISRAEYVELMRGLESRGLVLDPAPSVEGYRTVVVTRRLLELTAVAPRPPGVGLNTRAVIGWAIAGAAALLALARLRGGTALLSAIGVG